MDTRLDRLVLDRTLPQPPKPSTEYCLWCGDPMYRPVQQGRLRICSRCEREEMERSNSPAAVVWAVGMAFCGFLAMLALGLLLTWG